MARHVLVLTDESSPTVAAVCRSIQNHGGTVDVIAPSTLPLQGSIALSAETGTLVVDGTHARLDDDTTVWAWHPHAPQHQHPDPQRRRFVAQEWRLALAGLRAIVPPPRWINDTAASHPVEGNRLLQLRIAESAGYAVPDTLVSNDPNAIVDFAASYDRVAVKTLGGYWEEHAAGARVAFTHVTTADALAAVPCALASAPVVVQPYIKKRFEWRVTVVDSTAFFARIDSQDTPAAMLDWRRAELTQVKHTLTDPSPGEHDRAVRTVAVAGLRYAAIDLIETPDGQIYFLDLNPSGQYGWIEQQTGAPVTDTLAAALLDTPTA